MLSPDPSTPHYPGDKGRGAAACPVTPAGLLYLHAAPSPPRDDPPAPWSRHFSMGSLGQASRVSLLDRLLLLKGVPSGSAARMSDSLTVPGLQPLGSYFRARKGDGSLMKSDLKESQNKRSHICYFRQKAYI